MATTFFVDNARNQAATTAAPTHLHWRDSAGELREQPLTAGAVTVGGGPRCLVRVEADDIRPLHCVIAEGSDGVTVRRWSTGTNLNGRTFTVSPLRVGDRLSVAGVELWTAFAEPEDEQQSDSASTEDHSWTDEPSPEEHLPDSESASEGDTSRPDGLVVVGTPPAIASADPASEESIASPVDDADAVVDPTPPAPSPTQSPAPSPTLSPPAVSTVDAAPFAFESIESFDAPPVPARLLKPWLNAQEGNASEDAKPDESETCGDAEELASETHVDDESVAREIPFADEPTAEEQGVPASDREVEGLPAATRLTESLVNTRRRARAITAALRRERAVARRTSEQHKLASSSRDELATRLLLTTTELHDCRSELAEAKAELDNASTDRDDHRRLYDLAKEEIDELEQRVEELKSDRQALVDEQASWASQRVELEAAIAALEARMETEPSAFGSTSPAAPDTDLIDPDHPSSEPHVAEGPAGEDSAGVGATEWADEAASDTVADTPDVDTDEDDNHRSETESEFNWSPSPTPEATAGGDSGSSEDQDESAAAPSDPWAGVWSVESSDDSAPSVAPTHDAPAADSSTTGATQY
ncbi:MAG: hypothetical protein AAF596_02025, partial [Planctomycetota bacterium]